MSRSRFQVVKVQEEDINVQVKGWGRKVVTLRQGSSHLGDHTPTKARDYGNRQLRMTGRHIHEVLSG